ncbi:MAG: ferredoxin [Candidatus Magasanikbacteria bacterium]|nr:ferredoxin [Candidatus Magasanikbacteria bacterium]
MNLPEEISEKIRGQSLPAGRQGKIRRLVIDRAKCIGAGTCVAVAPGVFQIDKENLAYVVDPDSTDEDTIMLAAQSCPVLAVLLYDQNGNLIYPK